MYLRSGTIRYFKRSISFCDSLNDSISSENMADELKIISFDPDSGMKIENWLTYFNNLCAANDLDNEWKIANLSNYLKGTALTILINECLACDEFDQIQNILIERFIKVNVPNFSDFTNLTLNNFSQLDEYFHKKLEFGRKLKLNEDLILQGLTDGLKPEFRNILLVNPPANPTDWFKIVTRLASNSSSTVSTTSTNYNRNNFQQPRFNSPRHWMRPNQIQNRGFAPRAPVNHMSQNLPPRPCNICTNKGIMNAYHWERDCYFRNQSSRNEPNVSSNTNA